MFWRLGVASSHLLWQIRLGTTRKALKKARGKKAGDGEIFIEDLKKQMQKDLSGTGEKIVDDIEAAFELAIDNRQTRWAPMDEVLINMALFVDHFEKECLPTFRSLCAQSVSPQNGDRTALDGIVAQKE